MNWVRGTTRTARITGLLRRAEPSGRCSLHRTGINLLMDGLDLHNQGDPPSGHGSPARARDSIDGSKERTTRANALIRLSSIVESFAPGRRPTGKHCRKAISSATDLKRSISIGIRPLIGSWNCMRTDGIDGARTGFGRDEDGGWWAVPTLQEHDRSLVLSFEHPANHCTGRCLTGLQLLDQPFAMRRVDGDQQTAGGLGVEGVFETERVG